MCHSKGENYTKSVVVYSVLHFKERKKQHKFKSQHFKHHNLKDKQVLYLTDHVYFTHFESNHTLTKYYTQAGPDQDNFCIKSIFALPAQQQLTQPQSGAANNTPQQNIAYF